MKNYYPEMEMITRQVESSQITPISWFLVINEIRKAEKAYKLILYFRLCNKIEKHHWKTNFRGVHALFDLQVKKIALARFMGLTQ